MSRKNAIFDGSRLYRQSEETARILAERLSQKHARFERAITLISENNEVQVQDADAAWALHSRLQAKASNLARRISPYHAIPSFLQGAHECYFGDAPFEAWMGPAFKVATALVWPNVHRTDASTVLASQDEQAFLLEAAGLVDQVFCLGQALAVQPKGRAAVTCYGVHLDKSLERTYDMFARAFHQRGKVLRFTQTSPFLHPAKILDGALDVLTGTAPMAAPGLAGTPLAKIPKGERPDFWVGILWRIMVLAAAHDARQKVSGSPGGLAIIGPSAFSFLGRKFPEDVTEILQTSLHDCFWTPEWFTKRSNPESLRHLMVERPVLRLTSNQELFATTASNILDSLSAFLDASVGPYWDRGGARLSEKCFRRLISLPFEEEVISVLRRLGFEAGNVSENGAWATGVGQQPEDLAGISGAPPGEIDVLAFHPCGLAIVAECKALNLPFHSRALRNLYGKLSSSDDDGFHGNLSRKLTWVDQKLRLKRRLTGEPVGVLVVDHVPPFDLQSAPHLVADAETLERGLASLLEEHAQSD